MWAKELVKNISGLRPGALLMAVFLFGGMLTAQVLEIPNEAEWAGSGHADDTSEAFRHWDEDDPPLVSTSCAKCHSGNGFQDFMGADRTEPGVDADAEPAVITCVDCHNDATQDLDSVVFPSGVEVSGLDASAVCLQCHQGRASTPSVDARIADANLPDDNTAGLGFVNIHYAAAGATQYGGVAMGGYQYAGKAYDAKFAHVEGVESCIDCHDAHSLEVEAEACATCHMEVTGPEDLAAIRHLGSMSDYDGDNNAEEGIADEIHGLQEILYAAIQAQANAMGAPIIYDSHAYPYFFKDTNGNGESDEGEADYGNKYDLTARLLRAAYNYQAAMKDHGAYAHGGKYMIQLLYDAIEDLDASLVEGLTRDDAGHFAGSKEAFRHWDEDGEVSGRCSRCHTATGLPFYLENGVNIAEPVANGLMCSTCHTSVVDFGRYEVAEVAFPSGAVLDTGDPDSNICLNCHQGRESGLSVEDAIAAVDPDTAIEGRTFINVHYKPAGATRFGTEAKGAFEYAGREYKGRFRHISAYNTCAECHDAHSGEIEMHGCMLCHKGIEAPSDIRLGRTDYDGDGDKAEGVAGEIETLREALLAALQANAPIIYANNYPYFFFDTNENGEVDSGEASYGNRYVGFTPRLLKAAYNYQFATKDPGAYAHNAKYVIQVLYDSIEDLGGDVSGMNRP